MWTCGYPFWRKTHTNEESALPFLLPICVLTACAMIVSRSGRSVCPVGTLEAEEMEAYSAATEVISYSDRFEGHLSEVIAGLLPAQRIALSLSQADPSADGLSLTQYRRISICPDANNFRGETVSVCNIIRRVRGQKSPAEVAGIEHTVQEAEHAAISSIAPGVYTTVPQDAAKGVFERLGSPKVGGLGHELGTYAHEDGMRCGSDFPVEELDCRFEAGMTFTMEPAIITSCGRLCQEEVIAVSDTGCRYLSIPQEEIWLVR